MKMMKKSASAALLALAITALFAGCTGDNKATDACEGDKACTDTSATCADQPKACCAGGASKAEACTKSKAEAAPAN